MGLDVYLHRYEDYSESKRREKEYELHSESLWGDRKYEEIEESERESIRNQEKAFAKSLGLSDYGSDETLQEQIEIPSAKYPEHYFKIGYFRSSYNESGINRILKNLGVMDLYEIFEPGDRSDFKPDWEKCLSKTTKAIKQLKTKPNLACFQFSWNQFQNPDGCQIIDTETAIAAYMDEVSKKSAFDDGAYSNNIGHFQRKEPLKVMAIIHGTSKVFFADAVLPCAYIIHEGDNEWYINALEIVHETIEFVLSKPDKDKYVLHWSS